MYKVLFFPPFEKEPKTSWFSIEDIADFHSSEKRKRNDLDNEEKELKIPFPTTLSYEVVEYLRNNPHNAKEVPLDVFLTQPQEGYLQEMSRHRTYGDQITLQAVADMLSCYTWTFF